MVAAGSITVAVRVRPPTQWEAARLPEPCYDTTMRGDGALSTPASVANTATLRDIVQIVDDRILTFDPDEKDRARAFMERGFLPPGTKRYKDRRFMFDKVFGHEAQQQEVYEATAQPLLSRLLDGYNATVFAYGATGCGKTHTISGTDTDPGIIYLTMADLFQRIDDRKDDWNVEVLVTFLEIYNEEIRDLLAEPGSHVPRGGLSIREDKVVKVVGLTELKPRSAEEVKQIVLQGNALRTQSPTHANETSSRSHAVLQVHVTQSPRTAGVTEQRTVGTLSIIDLAGSERAAATMNMGQRMVEGANINKSLLALGNCINALCESGGAIRHVPYRNSKLTRLLKFSLGGNCKTVMIVCVAPTSNHFDDTHNTLIYAERATKIKTKVVTRNVVNVERHVGRYVEAITRLNEEVKELKAKLAGKQQSESDVVRRKRAEANAEVERAKNDLKAKVEHTRSHIADGASCQGKLSAARIKLRAIQRRLAEIDIMASSNPATLPTDVAAERALLQALASPEEQALEPKSPLSIRLQRSANSSAMFDATLRALSERRSDKLDEFNIDSIKLDVEFRRAEMEKVKAEEERDALRGVVEDMAQTIVGLMSMLGRSTLMVGEAANALGSSYNSEDDESVGTVSARVASMLRTLKEKNDQAFNNLVGQSTEAYLAESRSSVLDNFTGYAAFTRRISSVPSALQHGNSRRPSLAPPLSASVGGPSSPRRGHRTPRKSLRSSLAGQPYRRVSDKDKKPAKGCKNVQWRDEAGQGQLDDRSPKPVSVIITHAEETSTPTSTSTSSSSAPGSSSRPPSRAMSATGSESDWEDENNMTDDSANTTLLSRSLPPSSRDSLASSNASRAYGSIGAKRPRASRLDPSFLKSKTRGSVLGSLAEDDESSSSPEKRPLSDRNLNQLADPENSLFIPKGKDRHHTSFRGPTTPRIGHGSSSGLGKSTTGRRRSNIGPLRSEKGRRRSSLIPQLSPRAMEGGEEKSGAGRRMLLSSPAKRAKRPSLLGSKSMTIKAPKAGNSSMTGSMSVSNMSLSLSCIDGSSGEDTSFKGSKPTWR